MNATNEIKLRKELAKAKSGAVKRLIESHLRAVIAFNQKYAA